MKINKSLAAALIMGIALTGCESANTNDSNSPVVEEVQDETTMEETEPVETIEPTETLDETEDATTGMEDVTTEEDTDMTDTEGTEAGTETAVDTSTMSIEEKREALEKAIFDNRSQARAVEILLELTPEKVADIEPQLQELLQQSNDLLARAQVALDQLNAQ